MIAQGADIIDIGAVSTRPDGAEPVSADQELKRLQPILTDVVSLGIPVSIDSMKSAVVGWALDAGAPSPTTSGACSAIPTWRGSWRREVRRSSSCTTVTALSPTSISCGTWPASHPLDRDRDEGGIHAENIVLDPGIGFGKTAEQSITALARLDELRTFGLPLLVGASRKRFISSIGARLEPHQRLGGSIAATFWPRKAARGSSGPHDVAETVQALRVADSHLGQTMTDRIFITGVVIHARHGVMEHETEVGQRFVIDLELATDLSEILAYRSPRRYRVLFQRGRDRDRGFQGCQLQAFGTRRRRGRRRRAGGVSAHQRGQGHRPQAARADRRDFRGCRRRADAHAASAVASTI